MTVYQVSLPSKNSPVLFLHIAVLIDSGSFTGRMTIISPRFVMSLITNQHSILRNQFNEEEY